MMTKIQIYSKTTCPACVTAKSLLDKKGVEYEEIILDNKPKEIQELINRTGMKTVPQIFINGELIGGCSDLMDLDEQKKLDTLLNCK